MSIPNGGDFNLLSHELKHGYQFETGNFSFNGIHGSPFYDKYDELDAYQRGALFGGTRYNSINELPPLHNMLQDGPQNASSYIEQTTYRKYSSKHYETSVRRSVVGVGWLFGEVSKLRRVRRKAPAFHIDVIIWKAELSF